MDARKNLIFNLLESNLKKSPSGRSSAPSANGQLSADLPMNEEKPEPPPLKILRAGQEKPGHGTRRWSDKAQLHDLIAHNLRQRISPVPSADEDQQLHDQVTDLEGVRLSADSHDYGELVIGTFQQFVLTIFNERNAPLTIEKIEGLPTKEFKLSNPPALPVTLPPHGSQFLTVIFNPLTEGEKHLTFSLAVKDHHQKLFSISLRGTAVVLSADEDQQLPEQATDLEGVRFSADNHDFGELVIGTFQQFVLTIFNERNAPLTIEKIGGLPTKEFKLSNPPALPVTLPPHGSQFFTVIFIPLTAGEKHLTFSLAVKDRQQKLFTVSVSGTAVKGYLLPPDVINVRGFRKLLAFAPLGRGEVCPCCEQGEVTRVRPRLWMRLIPGSQHFECRVCGARFWTIGNRGKVINT
jgi:hypothetical protein